MYAVLNMGYTPSQFARLSRKEQAFITACVQIKIDEEKKANAKMKSRRRR